MAEPVDFELLSKVDSDESIADGRGIDKLSLLKEKYGGKNWSNKKGVAIVDDYQGYIGRAEVHWYEAHGVGRVDWKIKIKLEK